MRKYLKFAKYWTVLIMNRVFKRCLITGIAGSGGSYLAEYILKKSPSVKIFGFRRSIGYSTYLKKNINQKF